MANFSVTILFQLLETSMPYRVEVTLRELHFLDRHAQRSIAADGMVLYRMPGDTPRDRWREHLPTLAPCFS